MVKLKNLSYSLDKILKLHLLRLNLKLEFGKRILKRETDLLLTQNSTRFFQVLDMKLLSHQMDTLQLELNMKALILNNQNIHYQKLVVKFLMRRDSLKMMMHCHL